MKRRAYFRCGLLKGEPWEFKLFLNYYDGPYWDLHLFNFWAVWNLDGLPYIFWHDEPKKEGAKG